MDGSLALVMQTSANALKTDLETVNVTFNCFLLIIILKTEQLVLLLCTSLRLKCEGF